VAGALCSIRNVVSNPFGNEIHNLFTSAIIAINLFFASKEKKKSGQAGKETVSCHCNLTEDCQSRKKGGEETHSYSNSRSSSSLVMQGNERSW
jgi:hypothetical protein